MSFLEEMEAYRDRFGFPIGNAPKPGPPPEPSGNCLMFLAEEMLILKDQGLLRFQDVARFSALVAKCQLEFGNYARTPQGCLYRGDQEEQDDFIGLAAASAAIGTAQAFQIFTFGRLTTFQVKGFDFRFAFPTREVTAGGWLGIPTTDANAWLGRNPAFVAHLYWAAGQKPNWFYRFAWCWAVAFTGWFDPTGQDPWRLTYLFARTAPVGKWWTLERWAAWLWARRLFKHWPGGMPAVRKRYFNDSKHPLATWMKEASLGEH